MAEFIPHPAALYAAYLRLAPAPVAITIASSERGASVSWAPVLPPIPSPWIPVDSSFELRPTMHTTPSERDIYEIELQGNFPSREALLAWQFTLAAPPPPPYGPPGPTSALDVSAELTREINGIDVRFNNKCDIESIRSSIEATRTIVREFRKRMLRSGMKGYMGIAATEEARTQALTELWAKELISRGVIVVAPQKQPSSPLSFQISVSSIPERTRGPSQTPSRIPSRIPAPAQAASDIPPPVRTSARIRALITRPIYSPSLYLELQTDINEKVKGIEMNEDSDVEKVKDIEKNEDSDVSGV